MIDESSFKKLSVFFLIGILIILTFLILWPLWTAIVVGLLMAYIFNPFYLFVLKYVRQKTISGLIVVFFVLFLIFIPLWFLLPILFKQIVEIYLYLQKIDVYGFIEKAFPSLINSPFSQTIVSSANSIFSGLASKIFAGLSSFLLDLPNLALKGLVVFFTFFFAMRDSRKLKDYVKSLSPFNSSIDKELSLKFTEITKAVIYGHILIGIIQGILTGIGLFIFGVPQPLFFTLIAMLAAMIPFLGAWLVWIPAGIYLLISGNIGAGIALMVFGATVVSWIDNFIRPYIISRSSNLPSSIILIGMIGGLLVFGFLGMILGPLILAYLLILLDAYRQKQFSSIFNKE